jgi:hypothetical protein
MFPYLIDGAQPRLERPGPAMAAPTA